MTQRIYTDRSRVLDHQRCPRLRYLGYHAGSEQRGLAPVRKSIHLVLGGAVHAGLEVLLREGQTWLTDRQPMEVSVEAAIEALFTEIANNNRTEAWAVENMAVEAALADLAASTAHGVELDDLEKLTTEQAAELARTGAGVAGGGVGDSPLTGGFGDWDPKTGQFRESAAGASAMEVGGKVEAEPMLEITFPEATAAKAMNDFTFAIADSPLMATAVADATTEADKLLRQRLEASLALDSANLTSEPDWSKPVYLAEEKAAAQAQVLEAVTLDTRLAANAMAASGLDGYLREELAAQVEAMVRAYARRRWRPLLAQFEVLEVEREGEWKLGDLPSTIGDDYKVVAPSREGDGFQMSEVRHYNIEKRELWFMSRADALLRERTTSYLYIMSYKTTGAWDRRREQDAQVDMQGLSEAVDIEKRMAEAWQAIRDLVQLLKVGSFEEIATMSKSVLDDLPKQTLAEFFRLDCKITELVGTNDPNMSFMRWLATLPDPPRILGVRYEYLIKGARRQDKSDPESPGRYVADTPLIRAYKFDGLTADDRRWATHYTYHTLTGKSSRLDYRAWKKAPVWRYMTVAQWIDLLDQGEVQPDIYDEAGNPVDVLAEQFVPPIHVWRNDDDMRDMLQQLEAEEVRVAENVARLRNIVDKAEFRSILNRTFFQSRKACSYPGKCQFFEVCYGPQTIRDDPESSGLYSIRTPNHPQEAGRSVETSTGLS